MQGALMVYVIAFVSAAFVWPTFRVWRRDGVNAFVLPRDDSAQGVVAVWLRVLVAAILLVSVAQFAGTPSEAFGRLSWLEAPGVRGAGWASLGLSLVWIVVAQAHMGRSWRIGIDESTKPPLVRTGLFSRTRNPVFLGMRLTLFGLFLVWPNGATLTLRLLGEVLIQIQVRLEEVHLRSAFGSDYDRYCRAAPRWL